MVTALATVNGRSVGIIGNNPADKGGIVDIAAADKAARFIRVCDSFNLPLIVLVDSMGLPVELKQEHGGLIRHGAKLIYALAEACLLYTSWRPISLSPSLWPRRTMLRLPWRNTSTEQRNPLSLR